MRQITEQAVRAFMAGRKFNSGNTSVNIESDLPGREVVVMRLHDNLIAKRVPSTGYVACTLANWPTLTTRERLNGICAAIRPTKIGFYQYKGDQYYVGTEINADQWVTVRRGS